MESEDERWMEVRAPDGTVQRRRVVSYDPTTRLYEPETFEGERVHWLVGSATPRIIKIR